MNRKMQCLALAGKCVGDVPLSDAQLGEAKKPCRPSRSTRASEAKPPPNSHKKLRRDRPQGVGFGMTRVMGTGRDMSDSVGIDEFVQVQDDAADLHQGGV